MSSKIDHARWSSTFGGTKSELITGCIDVFCKLASSCAASWWRKLTGSCWVARRVCKRSCTRGISSVKLTTVRTRRCGPLTVSFANSSRYSLEYYQCCPCNHLCHQRNSTESSYIGLTTRSQLVHMLLSSNCIFSAARVETSNSCRSEEVVDVAKRLKPRAGWYMDNTSNRCRMYWRKTTLRSLSDVKCPIEVLE